MKRYRIADTAIPGAHAQVWVEAYQVAARDRLAVRREDDTPDGQVAILPVAWLEEVKPPSIDDPVTLPLHVLDDAADRILTVEPSDVPNYPAQIKVRLRSEHVDKDGSYAVALIEPTAEQCRAAARALWRLGTQQPAGFPIGTRHTGSQGPVAVQQPGTGAD